MVTLFPLVFWLALVIPNCRTRTPTKNITRWASCEKNGGEWTLFYPSVLMCSLPTATLRTIILMICVICAGGTIFAENPANSLVALQPRFVWLVNLLQSHSIPVPCLSSIWYDILFMIIIYAINCSVLWKEFGLQLSSSNAHSGCASICPWRGRGLGCGQLQSASVRWTLAHLNRQRGPQQSRPLSVRKIPVGVSSGKGQKIWRVHSTLTAMFGIF